MRAEEFYLPRIFSLVLVAPVALFVSFLPSVLYIGVQGVGNISQGPVNSVPRSRSRKHLKSGRLPRKRLGQFMMQPSLRYYASTQSRNPLTVSIKFPRHAEEYQPTLPSSLPLPISDTLSAVYAFPIMGFMKNSDRISLNNTRSAQRWIIALGAANSRDALGIVNTETTVQSNSLYLILLYKL